MPRSTSFRSLHIDSHTWGNSAGQAAIVHGHDRGQHAKGIGLELDRHHKVATAETSFKALASDIDEGSLLLKQHNSQPSHSDGYERVCNRQDVFHVDRRGALAIVSNQWNLLVNCTFRDQVREKFGLIAETRALYVKSP